MNHLTFAEVVCIASPLFLGSCHTGSRTLGGSLFKDPSCCSSSAYTAEQVFPVRLCQWGSENFNPMVGKFWSDGRRILIRRSENFNLTVGEFRYLKYLSSIWQLNQWLSWQYTATSMLGAWSLTRQQVPRVSIKSCINLTVLHWTLYRVRHQILHRMILHHVFNEALMVDWLKLL